jgi:hypothetical protein
MKIKSTPQKTAPALWDSAVLPYQDLSHLGEPKRRRVRPREHSSFVNISPEQKKIRDFSVQ